MDTNDMKTWRVQSPNTMGFHKVITPDQSACQVAQIFRLNLPKGASYTLQSNELELHPVLIQGKAMVQHSVLGRLSWINSTLFISPLKTPCRLQP